MCSDGLTGELTEQLIAATLIAQPDPQRAAQELVQQAVDAGGRDNVTAVVIDAVDVAHEHDDGSMSGDHTSPEVVVVAAGGDTLPGLSLPEDGL